MTVGHWHCVFWCIMQLTRTVYVWFLIHLQLHTYHHVIYDVLRVVVVLLSWTKIGIMCYPVISREIYSGKHHPTLWIRARIPPPPKKHFAAISISFVLNRWTDTHVPETWGTLALREVFALMLPLFCSHRVFLVSHFLGFVCRSMPMLEKLSMPLAVRLAGITNCHVFVHALRTIKWKISYLQYNSHVITHIH